MYRINVSLKARIDIAEAYDWFFDQSLDAAEEWLSKLTAAIQTLDSLPMRCPAAAEARYFSDNPPRQLLAGRYRVLFEVRGRDVVVLHVRHVARDYAQKEDFDVKP
jgi:toxin ParE1/3/4